MFMIGACSLVLLVVEAVVGDLTRWQAIVIAGVTGAIAGLGFAELGLRSNRWGFERPGDGHRRLAMAPSDDERTEFVKDPLGYAEETHRMAEELQRHIFPPWRWPGWYRRRRVIEERLHNLRVLQPAIEESEREDG